MSMVPQTGIMQFLSSLPQVTGFIHLWACSDLNHLQKYPFAFQLPIASIKTWAADYLVQTQVERREEIDVNRSLTFAAFGLLYSGGFQYAVNPNLIHVESTSAQRIPTQTSLPRPLRPCVPVRVCRPDG